jgi:MFS family permease
MNESLRSPGDIRLLFSTRIVRLFCYGFLSVILALYLAAIFLSEVQIGLLFTMTLLGDAVITLYLTTTADRFGRRRTLLIGALLMFGAGIVFLFTRNIYFLILAAVIGVISPSGNEIGPFLSVEQASLTQLLPDTRRTQIFAWYNMSGSFATAAGALVGGWLTQVLQYGGIKVVNSYKAVLLGYAIGGLVLLVLFLFLSLQVEVPKSEIDVQVKRTLGLYRSKNIVFRLSALFGLDAFAGGFVVQSLVAFWFFVRFQTQPGVIGSIFFGANILAGISALLAGRLAKRFGLINTMVFTHIPSNILLMLVPLMPTLESAVVVLLARFAISQMDVPTRQSYTMAIVEPDERSAASGVTSIARSLGAAISPSLTGYFLSNPLLLGLPFFLSGGLKIIYDILLFRSFRNIKPPEEASPLVQQTNSISR